MTIFGNRDFEHAPLTAFEDTGDVVGWAPEETFTEETRRIVIRVQGADDVELGRVQGRDAAVRVARDMIRAIEEAQARGEWPQVEDRFIRPGAIVSVDVQRAE